MMGQDGLQSISRTSLIRPNFFLKVESAKCKLRVHYANLLKPSTSHRDFRIVERLAPKSHKAKHS